MKPPKEKPKIEEDKEVGEEASEVILNEEATTVK